MKNWICYFISSEIENYDSKQYTVKEAFVQIEYHKKGYKLNAGINIGVKAEMLITLSLDNAIKARTVEFE